MKDRRTLPGPMLPVLLSLVFLVLGAGTGRVKAAPGDLDPSFGSAGLVTTDFGGVAEAHGVSVQGDGKVLLVGEANEGGASSFHFALSRYNVDGRLDTTFGNGGKVITSIGPGDDIANTVSVTDDDKIVVAGRSFNGTNDDFALVRYDPNGSLDATFGNGGIVVAPTGPGNDRVFLVDSYPGGKLLALGLSSTGSGNALMLARFSTDGVLDPSFGIGGIATDVSAHDPPLGFLIQDNGGLLITSVVANRRTLTRYGPSGDRDLGFGSNGALTIVLAAGIDEVNRARTQQGGRLIVAGALGGRMAVARYFGDGSLDASFGAGGIAVPNFGEASGAFDLSYLESGKLVVAGGSNGRFAVARFDGSRPPPQASGSPAPLEVITGDDRSRTGAAVVQGAVTEFLGRYSVDYGLVAKRPLRIYVTNDEAAARSRLSSDFGETPSAVDGFFRNEVAVRVVVQLGYLESLVYLPNTNDLRGDVAFVAGYYAISAIGAGFEQTDAYPSWFLNGFTNYQSVRFSERNATYRRRASDDVKARKAPALAKIAAEADLEAFTNNDDDKQATADARGESAVEYLAKTYGEAALGRLMNENAFGTIAQFNAVLQRITGMTLDQFNGALDTWLQS